MKNVLLLLPVIFLSCAGTPSMRAPAWVSDVDSVYSRTRYVAAVGYGQDRGAAERNALAAVAAFFGQTVRIERSAVSSYQQAIIDGVIDGWIDTAEMRSNIRTTADMENLMGVEIAEVWFNSKDTYYAVAIMDKTKALQIYTELIQANLNVIKNLLAMTQDEKQSLGGVIRYRFAAIAADINAYYRNIVIILDGTVPDMVIGGEYYRLEAQNIIKTIPVNIRVTNDRNGRIFGAFAKSFTDLGFEASVGSSRYMLNADVNMSPVDLPNNPNIFLRIILACALVDTRENLVLLPYNFNSREGHITRSEAEIRAITVLERNINEEFSSLLSEYLSALLPKN